jgi:hypothetical protein
MESRSRGWILVELVSLALVLLAAVPSAQSGMVYRRVSKPQRSATLDLSTGTVTVGPRVSNRAGTTVVDFDNSDLGGFVGTDTGGGFCEWFDAGQKGWIPGQGSPQPFQNSGNLSDLMNSITFAYCSSALSASSGGPGGAVKLGFYEGYVTGGGAPTTAVALLTLTGLPAHTASSSFSGSFSCFFIRITMADLVPFVDGPIGYSWKFIDTGTTGPLAATFPFLSCVASCSGGPGNIPDGQGMDDVIDRYCPPGTLQSTFSFGSTSGTFTSVSMAIEEASTVFATYTPLNSTTFPNPDILTSSKAVVGEPWTVSLTLGLGRSKGSSWSLFFGTSLVAPPTGVGIGQNTGGMNFGAPKGGRMLLCAINSSGFACTGAHTGVIGSVSPSSCAGIIPLELSLVNNTWCGQAVVLGPIPGDGNARLSSAISGLVGTN